MVDFVLKRMWFAPGDKRRLDKIRSVSGMRLRAGTHRNMPDYLYPYLIGEKPGGPSGAVILKEPANPDAPEPNNLAEALGVGPFEGEEPLVDPAERDFSTMAKLEREADEQIKQNEAAKRASRDTSEPDDGKPTFEPPVEDDNPKAAAFAEALAAEQAEEAEKPKPRRRAARKKG